MRKGRANCKQRDESQKDGGLHGERVEETIDQNIVRWIKEVTLPSQLWWFSWLTIELDLPADVLR